MQVILQLTAVVQPAEAVTLMSSGLDQLHAAGEPHTVAPGMKDGDGTVHMSVEVPGALPNRRCTDLRSDWHDAVHPAVRGSGKGCWGRLPRQPQMASLP